MLAFQWLLDPDHNPATADAPNVVNISWGARQIPCSFEFQPDLQALRAAHILPVVAAGNDEPWRAARPPTTRPPTCRRRSRSERRRTTGRRTVTIAPFSSRGPSMCGGGQFPALVAPGTGIRSTGLAGFDATGLEGTSFSAPHVAGALALLLQISPLLTATEQASLLTQNAVDLGRAGSRFHLRRRRSSTSSRPRGRCTPPRSTSTLRCCRARWPRTRRCRCAPMTLLSLIGGGEWWADVDPGVGAGQPLTAADGALDSRGESLVASTPRLQPGPSLARHARTRRARATGAPSRDLRSPSRLRQRRRRPCPTRPVVPDVPPVRAPARVADGAALLLSSGLERRRQRRLRAGSRLPGPGASEPWRHPPQRRCRAGAACARGSLHARRRSYSVISHTLAREAELAFALNPRTFSSAGAWVEVAAITSAGGQRLASVDLRSLSGRHEIRLSSITGDGSHPALAAVSRGATTRVARPFARRGGGRPRGRRRTRRTTGAWRRRCGAGRHRARPLARGSFRLDRLPRHRPRHRTRSTCGVVTTPRRGARGRPVAE